MAPFHLKRWGKENIMMELTIGKKNYKVKFGFNSFCDTDLMDRTGDLLRVFQEAEVADDTDINQIGMIKDLFACVRELLFVGFQKYNPVESLQVIGDLLDDWKDEETDEERGIFGLFTQLTDELMSQGFLGDMMQEMKS